MPTSPMSEVIQCLRSAALRREGAELTDGQLLECFVRRREATALEALVRRHGPMVWGVCQRTLRNQHDAEDAFQATFLVLIRKAASIYPRAKVGNWLYGVAHQTALKARATRGKRQLREKSGTEMPEPTVTEQDLWTDLQPLLDREVSRLPEKYRTVIVLCELEGKSGKEASRQLGCPEGTVASRLARARTMLAKRLTTQGLALTGAALGGLLSQKAASAAVPTSVMTSTIKAVTLVAASGAASGLISAKVVALTEGVLKTMLLMKLKTAGAALFVVLCIVALGGWGAIRQTEAAQKEDEKPVNRKAAPTQVASQPKEAKAADLPDKAEPQEPKLRATLKGHKGPVNCVTFSPDGKTLASGGAKTIKLWDVATGKEQATFEGHTAGVPSVAYSPDGKMLASGSADQTIKLWDVKTGKELATLKGHTAPVYPVVFTADGKTLASGSEDNTIKLWDVATGKERTTIKDHTSAVYSLVYSPDGKTLASGSQDKTIKLWDVATGKEQATLKGHTECVYDVAYSPDGKTLASGSWDKTIKLWDVATGKERATLKGHTSMVYAVAYSPDGKTLASGSGFDGPNEIRLWDVATAKELATLKQPTDVVCFLAYSPDGKTLASSSWDDTIMLWEIPVAKREK